MRNFGIPETEPINKESFIRALCTQFQNIVSDASNEVDDIVASEYSRLLQESGIEIENVTPYYPGDDFTLVTESPLGEHEVGFYNKFEHQWIIKNNGQVNWENRYLKSVNHEEIKMRPINRIINIPKIKPGENATLKEIQDHLGVGRETVLNWISTRNMPAYKVGRLWKFKISEVDDWIRSGGADNRKATKEESESK